MAAATPVPGFPARDKEESVRERLDLLLELVSNINEVLWLRDLVEERILYVSPAFARIWGRSVEQLLSSPRVWIDSIHPGDRERVLSAAVSDARMGNDSCEYRILRPDGTIRWVYDRAYPIRNAKGEIYRLAGVVEDITDRRKPRGQ